MKTTLKYYRPYILPIVLIIAFLFGQAMCELALPGYMSDIINNGIVKQDMGYIRHTGLIMIAVAAATVVCAIMGSLLASRAAAFACARWRATLSCGRHVRLRSLREW